MPPHSAEEEPEACDRQPSHGKARHDDQWVVEAGPLRIIHIVEHPEEVPPAPCVVAALKHFARRSRDEIAAVRFVAEIDLPDR